MIPISTEVLFSLYGTFNQIYWPVPFVGYALCLLAPCLAIWPFRLSSRFIAPLLASAWLWNTAFQIDVFAPLNWGALIFGAFFFIEALLLVWLGIIRNGLDIGLISDPRSRFGLFLLAFALAYPALDALSGHPWPQMQLPGTLPSPTVLLTLGFLLMARGAGARRLTVIPMLWALTGGAAAIFLGIWQDVAMAVASLAASVLIFMPRSRQR